MIINYSQLSGNGREVVHTNETEEFIINAYKLDKSILKENGIKFTSKDHCQLIGCWRSYI